MLKINSAHVGFDLPRVRIHAHKTGSEERLVIADGVERRHSGVNLAVVSKHRHVDRCMEGAPDFSIRSPFFLHHAVTLALRNRPRHNLLHLPCTEPAAERTVRLARILLIKLLLQIPGYVAVDSLFGISLHARINGSVNLQTVSVYIIRRSVALRILFTPAAKRVGGERYRVDDILTLIP